MKARFLAALFLLGSALAAAAGTATLTRAEKLREQPALNASSLMELHRRATVRVLETRREWVKVEADGHRSGWVPAHSLSFDEADQAAPAGAGGPQRAPDPLPLPRAAARASNHALILTLGSPSPGGGQQGGEAAAIARLMGVPDGNIRQPASAGLDLDGVRRALAELDARMGERDRAFIYLSGERSGLREAGRCSSGFLLPAGQELLGSQELATHARQLAARAEQLLIVVDAGSATRAGACANPEDSLALRLNEARQPPARNNLLYLAAASPRDGSAPLAEALQRCLEARAPISAAAGMPSGRELRECAQAVIALRAGSAGAARVTLAGNGALIPAPLLVSDEATPQALFTGLHAQRDEGRPVQVDGLRERYRLAEPIRLSVTSRQPGYLYILAARDDGFTLLYPGPSDGPVRIDDRLSLALPAREPAPEPFPAGGPGRTNLLFLVTDAPRNFFRAGLAGAGAVAWAPAGRRTLRDLALEILEGDNSPLCTRSETRNLGAAQRLKCATGFGSALHSLLETP